MSPPQILQDQVTREEPFLPSSGVMEELLSPTFHTQHLAEAVTDAAATASALGDPSPLGRAFVKSMQLVSTCHHVSDARMHYKTLL